MILKTKLGINWHINQWSKAFVTNFGSLHTKKHKYLLVVACLYNKYPTKTAMVGKSTAKITMKAMLAGFIVKNLSIWIKIKKTSKLWMFIWALASGYNIFLPLAKVHRPQKKRTLRLLHPQGWRRWPWCSGQRDCSLLDKGSQYWKHLQLQMDN